MKRFFGSRGLRAIFALILLALLCAGCALAAPHAAPSPDRTAAPSATIPETYALPAREGFVILFVNVGRADAAILRFGETTVLIDTGGEASVPQLFAGLNLLGVEKIDAVFLTHSHEDHVGGLAALRANYAVSIVYSPLYSEKNKDGVSKIAALCEKLGLPHTALVAGDSVPVADGVTFSVLGPLVFNELDDNDNSLVLRFSVGNTSFLFVGDAQTPEEKTLLKSGANLAADVLKVGNHGNPDATGENFARAVSPCLAIVSTSTAEDANSANPRVLAALAPAQAHVTQDFRIGILLTPGADGSLTVSNPAPAADSPRVRVASLDAEKQTVTLVNDGDSPADLAGCLLFCGHSGAALRFPQGARLNAGETLTVSGEGGGGTFVFSGEKKPLSKKKSDVVTLYGIYGAILSSMED